MKRAREIGLSAIELMVVSTILSVLTLILYSTFRVQNGVFNRQMAQGVTQDELRTWTLRMVRDIRNSLYDPRDSGAFAVLVAAPTEFRATSDYDRDGSVAAGDPRENIGYRLNGDVLERWQGGTTWRPVIHGVTSFGFSYQSAVRQPVNQSLPYDALDDIAEVDFTIAARSETGGIGGVAAPILSEAGKATLRNLN